MRHKFCQESPRRQDTHGLILTERQQILVPGDNCARLDRESRCNDVIVIRITAGRANIGQRAVKHASDIPQFRAPCRDRGFVMAVSIPQPRREQRPFIEGAATDAG